MYIFKYIAYMNDHGWFMWINGELPRKGPSTCIKFQAIEDLNLNRAQPKKKSGNLMENHMVINGK